VIEHDIINSEDAGLPEGGYYLNLSDEPITVIVSTDAGQKAAEAALAEIHGRSYSGRHPELGRMINCQFCNLRHRENERKCVQKFTTVVNRGPEEKIVPERTAPQTKKGVLGAKMFEKRRLRPHSNRWIPARTNALAAKQRKKNEETVV
jgi:hypothetical protein